MQVRYEKSRFSTLYKCDSKTQIQQTWGAGAVKLCAKPRHLFEDNISVAHCMPHIWPSGGRYVGAISQTIHLKKLFSRATFVLEMVCLYLRLLTNYKTSKLTMLKNMQKCNILGLLERHPNATTAP